jgi:hypothetical protein
MPTPNTVHKLTAGIATTAKVAARMPVVIDVSVSASMQVYAAPALMVQVFGFPN